jgi:rhodanese-related sulfurtransferase
MSFSIEQDELPFEIDVHSVKELLTKKDDFLLLDCREPQEFEHCRIDGSLLIPMNETPQRIDELEPYREKRIVVHCHHGGRSHNVGQWLISQGFQQVQNMAGGIDAWSLSVDPEIPRY